LPSNHGQTGHYARVFIELTTHIPAKPENCLAENDHFFIFLRLIYSQQVFRLAGLVPEQASLSDFLYRLMGAIAQRPFSGPAFCYVAPRIRVLAKWPKRTINVGGMLWAATSLGPCPTVNRRVKRDQIAA